MSDKHRLTTPLVFSDFIRNAPPEEKETVYDDMMQRATEAQENIILLRPRSLSQTHLGKEWLEYARRLEAENERLVCDAFEQRKRALAAEAALAAERERGIRECVGLCIDQYLEDQTGTSEDNAYNKAVEHCIDALLAQLKAAPQEKVSAAQSSCPGVVPACAAPAPKEKP